MPIIRVVKHREFGVITGVLGYSTGVLGALAIFRVLVVDHDGIFGIITHGTIALQKEHKRKPPAMRRGKTRKGSNII